MNRTIRFSGLGFESGQTHRGLISSAHKAKSYFSILENAGLFIEDTGTIEEVRQGRAKFYSESDLKKVNWQCFEQAYTKTCSLLKSPGPLFNWGGDHSVALATVGAFTHTYSDGLVIWIDAHADLNLPGYSLTGNLHGMPLSILLNLNNIAGHNYKWMKSYLRPANLVYIGLRDLDPFEEETISRLGITAFTRRRVRKWGIDHVINEVIHKAERRPVHISFDIDSMDPRIAPSTGVPVEDGLSEDELNKMAERFHHSLEIKSVDIVEINPNIGTSLQVDQTFITAIHFLKKLFAFPGGTDESMGKRIETEYTSQMEWPV